MKQQMRGTTLFALAISLAAVWGGGLVWAGDDEADLLVLSDRIYTAEESGPWVEAFAVKDGVFSYVGDLFGAIGQIGAQTVIVDATGFMVTPGMPDSHCHYLWIGAMTAMMPWNMFNTESVDDVLAVVKKQAKTSAALPFVGGIGWRDDYIPGGKPTKEMLDPAEAKRPVLLMSFSGQSGWANSVATALMASRNPAAFAELVPDYRAPGEPTGFFRRFHTFNAFDFFTAEEMAGAERPMLTAMRRAVNEALSLGVTSLNDVQLYKAFYPTLLKFKARGGLKYVRGRASYYVGPGMLADPAQLGLDLAWWRSKAASEENDDHLRVGDSCKLYIDGVAANRTAFLFEPYRDDPTTSGEPDWSQEAFDGIIEMLDAKGLQACTHACGDAGANRVVNSYERAALVNPAWDRRHRVDHCEMPIPSDQARMAACGILAVMNPTHFFGDPARESLIGLERCQSIMPWRDMLDRGIHMSYSSDWCAGPANPAYGLLVAATRLNYNFDISWGPEQAVSLEEALHAYTAEAAYAMKMESMIGSISVGKKADFVIFSDDLTDLLTYLNILIQKSEMGTGLDDLVLATFTDGRVAYSSPRWTLLEVNRASIQLYFDRQGRDALAVTGTLKWPDGQAFEGTSVKVSLGDYVLDLTLDARGRARIGKNSLFSVGAVANSKLGTRRFSLSLRYAELANTLATDGLTGDETIRLPGDPLTLPMVVVIDGELQATMIDLKYRSRQGSSGFASGKGRPAAEQAQTLLDRFMWSTL